MAAGARARMDPNRLYIGLNTADSFLVAIAYTTSIVFRVSSGHLNALQLVLLGTMLEVAYFVLQLPTGVLADLVSRRLCVIAGCFLTAGGLLMQGLSAHFTVQLIAQIPVGFGAALGVGAQEAWLADETGTSELTAVFLRATQFGVAGGLAGSVLSGVLALAGLGVPFVVSGGLMTALGVVLVVVMPETRFRPADRAPRLGGVTRAAAAQFTGQVRKTHRALVAVPGLVLVLAMVACSGGWSEGFDRLWGAYLLKYVRFPHLAGLTPGLWFSVLAVISGLLSLGSTHWATRRTSRLGPDSVLRTLLAVTVAIAVGVAALAATGAFAVAVLAYLAVATLRPLGAPLITGWVVARVDAGVRATALSATDMFDSGGQIAGGPVVGAIGVLASVRVALLASGAALIPAAGLLVAAARRMRGPASGLAGDALEEVPDGLGT